MTFTDEGKLKHLKDKYRALRAKYIQNLSDGRLGPFLAFEEAIDDADYLIARLETSELLHGGQKPCHHLDNFDNCLHCKHFETWRKAAGK